MDIHSNAVPSSLPEDYFPGENNMEGGGGASLEWVSAFVEECLNEGGFTSQPPSVSPPTTATSCTTKPITPPTSRPTTKTRTKRRKLMKNHPAESSSPLVMVPQTYWLAESELLQVVLPRKEGEEIGEEEEEEAVVVKEEKEEEDEEESNGSGSGRRCTHCMSQKTPQWRTGPLGPKTLCNACGVRFKSGRLLPEYRPAKSPTFQTYKHSNSHKKVMEMRSTTSSSSSIAN